MSTIREKAEALVRADADASGDKLDKLLAGLESLITRVDTLERTATTRCDAESLAGKKEGEHLDKVLAHLDARLDAFEKKCNERFDSYGARLDAFETKTGKPEAKKDEEAQKGKEPEEKALKTEHEENSLKRNDAEEKDKDKKEEKKEEESRADAVTTLSARIDELQRRVPVEMPEVDRAQFVEAQSRNERVAQAFGDSAGAPRWLNGELLDQYRRRLIGKYKSYSKLWKDKDLASVHESVLDIAETQIYADAMEAARHPGDLGEGQLREVHETDRTGRRITRFFGDPEACWAPFKQAVRRVTGITTKFN